MATREARGISEANNPPPEKKCGSISPIGVVLLIACTVLGASYMVTTRNAGYARAQVPPVAAFHTAPKNLTAEEVVFLQGLTPQPIDDKPKSDRREYQYLQLPNGLKMINVQDKNATQFAMSVAVDAGSFDNPVHLPGLAHFCEHMLFLGTETFPEPDGFDKFISSAAGYNNAFTAYEHTVYYFEIAAASAEEGTERFSDFFRAPLFSDEFVAKEVKAINSEHAKNRQDPSHRTAEVLSAISNPNSPMSWFKTGDLDTLQTEPKAKNLNPVQELKTWYKDHYCPSRMTLVTIGPMKINTQMHSAAKHFRKIEPGTASCQKPRRSWVKPPVWPQERLQKFVAIEGTTPQSELWMHFPFPDIRKEYASAPVSYLNYVITYGGQNSLSQNLRDTLGLVSEFGLSGSGASTGFDLHLVARLTAAGKNNLISVLDVVFEYLSKLRQDGVDEELYSSLADVTKLQWDWSEPQALADSASALSEQLLEVPWKDVLHVGSRIDKPNATLVSKLLDKLRPDNMNVAIVDPAAEKTFFSGHAVQTLEHYGAKYVVLPFEDKYPGAAERWNGWLRSRNDPKATATAVLTSLRTANLAKADYVLPVSPRPIVGVPKHLNVDNMHASTLTLVQSSSPVCALYGQPPGLVPTNHEAGQQLRLLSQSAFKRSANNTEPQVWYRRGWVVESPKTSLRMDFVRPRAANVWESPPDDAMRLSLYSALLSEEMNPKMYDLSMTGVTYDVVYSPHTLSFSFGGFAPMIPELMNRVLDMASNGVDVTDTTRYKRIVRDVNESLNTFDAMPTTYALEDRNILISPGHSSRQEQLAALGRMTPRSVASSVREFLLSQPMQLTGLAMGNFNVTEATAAFDQIQDRAKRWPGHGKSFKAGEEVRHVMPVVRPKSPVELRRLNQRPGDGNDVTVVSLLVGVSTVEHRVVFGILSTLLSSVAYTELRTKRQLGYVVNGGISALSNIHYVSCVVQGDQLRADNTEGAIEFVYRSAMPKAIENMTAEEFASHKDALEQQLLTPPATASEEFAHFWGPIYDGAGCFELKDEMLAYLQSGAVTKKVLSDTWNSVLYPAVGLRTKVVVKHFAKEVPPRPTLAEARAIWTKEGVPESAFPALEAERAEAVVLDKADTPTREGLAANGGHFFTTLVCKRINNAGSSSNLRSVKKHERGASVLKVGE